jgi:hypothetical protein
VQHRRRLLAAGTEANAAGCRKHRGQCTTGLFGYSSGLKVPGYTVSCTSPAWRLVAALKRCLNQASATHPGGRKRVPGSSTLLAWARLSALMDLYIHPLYVLVSKILSFVLKSSALIHPLYHPLSTVGSTC